MFKLVLKDEEWARGYREDGNALITEDDTRCIFGIIGRECGVPDDLMRGCGNLGGTAALQEKVATLPMLKWVLDGLIEADSDVNCLVDANDRGAFSDAERLDLMRPILLNHGIEVEFQPREPSVSE